MAFHLHLRLKSCSAVEDQVIQDCFWLIADLDQALQKAMQAIGQKPVPLPAVEGPSDTEAMLRQRIAALEQQVSSLQSKQ